MRNVEAMEVFNALENEAAYMVTTDVKQYGQDHEPLQAGRTRQRGDLAYGLRKALCLSGHSGKA